MIGQTRRRLCLSLVFAATALATTADAQATALELGTVNTSNATTTLKGSTGGPEFFVTNSNGGQTGIKADSAGGTGAAILGVHTSAGGTGPGVQAISDSTQPGAFALFGLLRSSSSGFVSGAVRGQNNGTNTAGYGVFGSHAGGGVGVEGSAVSGYGVFGTSSTGTGGGFSGATGVVGTGFATNGNGVKGVANKGAFAAGVAGTTSTGAGVYGESTGGTGQGVSGYSTATNGVGVIGQANNGSGARGVWGYSQSGSGGYFSGITGAKGTSGATNGIGVVGEANTGDSAKGVSGTSSSGVGVYGRSTHAGSYPQNSGVLGESTADYGTGVRGISGPGGAGLRGDVTGHYAIAVEGRNSDPTGWSGFFDGKVYIGGGCTGCTGPSSLKIDDPLDPAHKYLQHAGVASSEQLDLYSGNALTDERGFATVRLPRWFQALNRSFRYQLTVVGKAHWDAKAAVWDEISHNRFTIRTDQPNVNVSWEVTGVRHDRYANANRGSVEVRKQVEDQGKYLHPELYGKPRSETIR